VRFEWVVESNSAQEWLDVAPFLIEGDTSSDASLGAPSKALDDIAKHAKSTLFSGLQIFFSPDKFSRSSPDVKHLAELAVAGGAEVLHARPPLPSSSELYDSPIIVISDKELGNEKMKEVLFQVGRSIVDAKWLLDSLSRYEALPRDDFRIHIGGETGGLVFQTQLSVEF